jgi:hypothetical protein
MDLNETAKAEFVRLRSQIEDLRNRLHQVRVELAECRERLVQRNEQIAQSDTEQHVASDDATTQTAGDTQMSHSTRATIDSIRARLETVEAVNRDNVERERAAVRERQNQHKQNVE